MIYRKFDMDRSHPPAPTLISKLITWNQSQQTRGNSVRITSSLRN